MSDLWREEFDTAYDVPPSIGNNPRLADISWHNDVCPSFVPEGWEPFTFRLWSDHPDPNEREGGPNASRFAVMDTEHGAILFESETDADTAIRVLFGAYSLPPVLADTFGAEWDALDYDARQLILRDCLVPDPLDCSISEYRQRIGAGNLASYVRCLAVRR